MPPLILATGGVRSGKSAWAERRIAELAGEVVTYVATAEVGDEEMARRIARHRERRPPAWRVVEAPQGADRAVRDAADGAVLVDCLSVLVSNALLRAPEREGEDAALGSMLEEADALRSALLDHPGPAVVVTNEVGMGVHPPTRLGRWFRDGLGITNARMAEAADEVVLLVSGIPVRIKG